MSLFLLLIVFLVVGVAANAWYLNSSTEELVRAWAYENGYRVIELEIVTLASNTKYGRTSGTANATLRPLSDVEDVPGRISWGVGLFKLTNIDFKPARYVSGDERILNLGREAGEEADREAAVLIEVNRRLDAITSEPNWMAPYDLDGSGHIDQEEWSILRGDVMDAVRGEFGAPGVQVVSVSGDYTASVEQKPTPLAHEHSDEDEGVLW